MRQFARAAVTALALSTLTLTLSGCGLFRKHVATNRPAAQPVRPVAPPQVAIQPARGETSQIVWNLRAGLNVAALSCRGQDRPAVAGDYARLLARHKDLLAAAYRQEQARQGAATFDREQTRIYNGFANQASPVQFCRTAGDVAQRANGLQSAALVTAAPWLLGELRASLLYPTVARQVAAKR